MTKKDYIRLANAINSNIDEAGKSIVLPVFLKDLCSILRKDNPRFDEDRFRRACNQSKGQK
jgi:hypothetical protein